MKDKRIFVSGGAGVIGRSLVPKLVESGAIVMVGDLEQIPSDFPSEVVYRQGDLNTLSQEEIDFFNPEIFIHLAASFERSQETFGHWEENFKDNVSLSHHLIDLLKNSPNLKRVVNASSYLIYDKNLYMFKDAPNQPFKLKETDPINPRNLTGMSKLSHEIELDFLSNFKSEDFSSVSARIYRGYGTNSRDIISRWIRSLINNEEITIYNEDGAFDYMFSEDTALGLMKLAESNISGVINLGTGNSRKVKDVVRILADHFPDMKLKKISGQDEFTEASEADTSLLEETLNWVPNSKLEDTIPLLIDFERNRKNNLSVKHGNVLITSSGAKARLINVVKRAVSKIDNKIRVIGGDTASDCLSSFFVDEFWKMPRIDKISFTEFLAKCKSLNISIIIPSRDGELEFFAKHKYSFLEAGIHVMVSDIDSVLNCIDKFKFSSLKGLNIIPSTLSIDDLEATKYVVKERFGAGSKSIGVNLAKSQAKLHAESLKHPIFQPFISGKELSVDAYISSYDSIKGLVMRERVKIVEGESKVTTTIIDEELEKRFAEIITSLKLYGHILLQAIIDQDNNIHVIECNPRFGGASPVSIEAGLDSFYWLYLESLGISLADYPYIKSKKTLTQIRYQEDIYI